MMRRIGAVLVLVGLGLMTAPVVFSVVTNAVGVRRQQEEQSLWERQINDGRRPATVTPRLPAVLPGADEPPARVAPALRVRESGPPPPAVQPFILVIPKISLRWLIREGTTIPHLRRNGAGHVPGTAAPGQPGVVGIAGHRTTYGAPFFRLSRVGLGDEVTLQTREDTFRYRVYDVRQVLPSQVEILQPRLGQRLLVVVTCSPPFSAKYRLVVFARLVSMTAATP